MASEESHPDLSTAALGLLVELLAARDRANAAREELAPWVRKVADPLGVWSTLLAGVTSADVRNLAFDVARIQVQALTELTRQSEELSKKIVERLKDAKRPEPARARNDADRLLVCNLCQGAAGEPHRGELVAPARIRRLPSALVLRPLEGGAEFPVAAAFTPAEDVAAGARVAVSVDPDPWIAAGKHYQALVPLAGTDVIACFKLTGGPPR